MAKIEKAFETNLLAEEPVRAEPSKSSSNLVQRLELACVGSCTCNMKTSAFEFHAERCPYRLYTEAIFEIVKQDPNRMMGNELEFLNESGEKVVVKVSSASAGFVTTSMKKSGVEQRRLYSIKEFTKLRDAMNMVQIPD